MAIMKRSSFCLSLILLELAGATSSFAADQATQPSDSWSWWHDMPWLTSGWIFPLACLAFMVVMLLFMMRRGGIGCMWHGRSTDRPGPSDFMARSKGDRSMSALAILNERYARGEIDRHEYEEKKAAIASSS